jgi:hypothetical protein
MSSQTVDIGSKSGKFKYILVQQGQQTLLRGDPNLDYHGREISFDCCFELMILSVFKR